MLFNSHEFIFLFLPAVLAGHWWVVRFHANWKAPFLLLASLAFYAFAGWGFLGWLLADIVANYALLVLMNRLEGRRRKGVLALVIALNVLALGATKYCGFFIENVNRLFTTDWRMLQIIVPLGISFFTFSQIAFAVGTYRRELPRTPFVDYALYVAYFPKLLMGPITEPLAFLGQLSAVRRMDWNRMAGGLQLFFFGLFKKVVFADAFSRAVAYGFGATDPLSTLDVMLVAICYTFEIYFDFSGYTDMAIGVSRMLGIELPANFDSPYRALSVRDFWKRWHLTLTGFLTRYVYFPLGGSRRGSARTYLNILVVFLVSGLWHGANWTFVLWGFLHGVLMVRDRAMERFDERVPGFVRWCAMFAVTNVLWLLFRSADLAQFKAMLKSLVSLTLTLDPVLTHSVTDPIPLWALLPAAFALCLFIRNNARREFRANVPNLLLTVGAAVVGVCLLGGSNAFVYFNF